MAAEGDPLTSTTRTTQLPPTVTAKPLPFVLLSMTSRKTHKTTQLRPSDTIGESSSSRVTPRRNSSVSQITFLHFGRLHMGGSDDIQMLRINGLCTFVSSSHSRSDRICAAVDSCRYFGATSKEILSDEQGLVRSVVCGFPTPKSNRFRLDSTGPRYAPAEAIYIKTQWTGAATGAEAKIKERSR